MPIISDLPPETTVSQSKTEIHESIDLSKTNLPPKGSKFYEGDFKEIVGKTRSLSELNDIFTELEPGKNPPRERERILSELNSNLAEVKKIADKVATSKNIGKEEDRFINLSIKNGFEPLLNIMLQKNNPRLLSPLLKGINELDEVEKNSAIQRPFIENYIKRMAHKPLELSWEDVSAVTNFPDPYIQKLGQVMEVRKIAKKTSKEALTKEDREKLENSFTKEVLQISTPFPRSYGLDSSNKEVREVLFSKLKSFVKDIDFDSPLNLLDRNIARLYSRSCLAKSSDGYVFDKTDMEVLKSEALEISDLEQVIMNTQITKEMSGDFLNLVRDKIKEETFFPEQAGRLLEFMVLNNPYIGIKEISPLVKTIVEKYGEKGEQKVAELNQCLELMNNLEKKVSKHVAGKYGLGFKSREDKFLISLDKIEGVRKSLESSSRYGLEESIDSLKAIGENILQELEKENNTHQFKARILQHPLFGYADQNSIVEIGYKEIKNLINEKEISLNDYTKQISVLAAMKSTDIIETMSKDKDPEVRKFAIGILKVNSTLPPENEREEEALSIFNKLINGIDSWQNSLYKSLNLSNEDKTYIEEDLIQEKFKEHDSTENVKEGYRCRRTLSLKHPFLENEEEIIKFLYEQSERINQLGFEEKADLYKTYAESLKKTEELGIYHPFRYTPQQLNEIVKNRLNQEVDNRERAVVIVARSDHNGFLSRVSDVVDKLMKNNVQVMLYETDSDAEVFDSLLKGTTQNTHDPKKAKIICFAGHGYQGHLQYGENDLFASKEKTDSVRLDLQDLYELRGEGVPDTLSKDGQILLFACSAGQGGKGAKNVANTMREVFPQAENIFSSLEPTYGMYIKCDEKAKIKDIVNLGSETYTN